MSSLKKIREEYQLSSARSAKKRGQLSSGKILGQLSSAQLFFQNLQLWGGVRFGSQSRIVNQIHNFVNPVQNLTIFVEPVTPGDSSKSLRGAHVPSLT